MDGRLSSLAITNADGRSVTVSCDWSRGGLASLIVEDSDGNFLFDRWLQHDAWRPWLVANVWNGGAGGRGSVNRASAYDEIGRPVSRSLASAYNSQGWLSPGVFDSFGSASAPRGKSPATAFSRGTAGTLSTRLATTVPARRPTSTASEAHFRNRAKTSPDWRRKDG